MPSAWTPQLRQSRSHASLLQSTDSHKAKFRACDACRTKKSRCDGPLMSDGICSRCARTKRPCTYLNPSVPRGPPKAYITALEDRLEIIERLITTLRPDIDIVKEIGPSIPRHSWKDEPVEKTPPSSASVFHRPHKARLVSRRSTPDLTRLHGHLASIPTLSDDHDLSKDSDFNDSSLELEESLSIIPLIEYNQPMPVERSATGSAFLGARFHGKTAASSLLERTRRFKRRASKHTDSLPSENNASVLPNRRHKFWTFPPWERAWELRGFSDMDPILHCFPPSSLCRELIDLYFTQWNIFYPVLHRPSFLRQWDDGLHTRDPWFAAVCLSVFALSSRMTKNRGVLPISEQHKQQPNWHKAGVVYVQTVNDIHITKASLIVPSSLFELQTFPLIALFARGTKDFSASWIQIATAALKSIDVGIHNKRYYRGPPTLELELWKRVFFVLFALDRLFGSDFGRPYSIREEHFDLERPRIVDDEYLDLDPSHPNYFQRPPDQPSSMHYFNELLSLTTIAGNMVERIYSLKLSNASHLDQANLDAVRRTDEALSAWLANVPEHLKWSKQASLGNPRFSNQSLTLHSAYALVVSLLYRQFMVTDVPLLPGSQPPPNRPPFSARALCTTAARTIAKMMREHLEREEIYNVIAFTTTAYSASALLLLNAWQLRQHRSSVIMKGGDVPTTASEAQALSERIDSFMSDVNSLISFLESFQEKWGMISVYLAMLRKSLPQSGSGNDGSDNKASQRTDSGGVDDHNEKYPRAASFLPPSPPWEFNAASSSDQGSGQPQTEGGRGTGDGHLPRSRHPSPPIHPSDNVQSPPPRPPPQSNPQQRNPAVLQVPIRTVPSSQAPFVPSQPRTGYQGNYHSHPSPSMVQPTTTEVPLQIPPVPALPTVVRVPSLLPTHDSHNSGGMWKTSLHYDVYDEWYNAVPASAGFGDLRVVYDSPDQQQHARHHPHDPRGVVHGNVAYGKG